MTHTLLVKELEGRKNLTEVSLGFTKDLLDSLIGRQGENGNVHGCGTTWAKDGDGSNNPDSSFRADEELLDVEAYDKNKISLYLDWQLHLPVLSFLSLLKPFQIVPSGKTTSRPRTVPCKLPYLSNLKPPALVATLPPM